MRFVEQHGIDVAELAQAPEVVAVPPTTMAASSLSARRLAEQMPTSASGSNRRSAPAFCAMSS